MLHHPTSSFLPNPGAEQAQRLTALRARLQARVAEEQTDADALRRLHRPELARLLHEAAYGDLLALERLDIAAVELAAPPPAPPTPPDAEPALARTVPELVAHHVSENRLLQDDLAAATERWPSRLAAWARSYIVTLENRNARLRDSVGQPLPEPPRAASLADVPAPEQPISPRRYGLWVIAGSFACAVAGAVLCALASIFSGGSSPGLAASAGFLVGACVGAVVSLNTSGIPLAWWQRRERRPRDRRPRSHR